MSSIDNPNKFADKFCVKSSRLNNFDYSTPGYYFITICTLNHNNFFGKIINNKMELNEKGIITKSELLKTFEIRKNIKLHQWVIMPNHIHLLIQLFDIPVETPCRASLHENKIIPVVIHSHKNHPYFFKTINIKSKQEIPKLINQFKSSVKRICNQNNLFFAWQPRYHDEIIKDQKQLLIIKNYIQNNVVNWKKDKIYSL